MTLPEKRSPDDVQADEDTLYRELTYVTDRHNGDMTHAEITRCLFDFADSYAEVYDIERYVTEMDAPEHVDQGDTVTAVIVPDADENTAPINWKLDQ